MASHSWAGLMKLTLHCEAPWGTRFGENGCWVLSAVQAAYMKTRQVTAACSRALVRWKGIATTPRELSCPSELGRFQFSAAQLQQVSIWRSKQRLWVGSPAGAAARAAAVACRLQGSSRAADKCHGGCQGLQSSGWHRSSVHCLQKM